MLEPWALRNKGWKKAVYSALVEQRNLGGAGCLHALTENEAADYRRWGAKAPIAVIPIGVSLPPAVSKEMFLMKHPELRGKEIVLFLGRLHFKKGLDILCRAWRESNRLANSHLVLAGPDFDGTRKNAEKMVAEFGIASSVTFTGMLTGDAKWSALAASQAFVLPSRSEGLSVSVLEAMGMCLPVIVSERCNTPEIRTAGAGWVIRPQVSELRNALNEFFSSSESDRQKLGYRGNRLVTTKYNWTRIGEQISALYEWLQGGSRASTLDVSIC
jgi:glycosyltransferase involved in cell wall biosynthesis